MITIALFNSILLLLLSFLIYKFRYQLFYSQNIVNVNKVEDKEYNLVNYIETILDNGQTRKQRISHDLINDIFITQLNNQKINIKKLKQFPLVIRVLLQLVSKGPIWLIKYFMDEADTLSINESELISSYREKGSILLNKNNLKIHLCHHKGKECVQFNRRVLEAILLNFPEANLNCNSLDVNIRIEMLDKILLPILNFIRGAGYLHYRHLVNKTIHWESPSFFKLVENIGKELDSDIFRIRIRLAHNYINVGGPPVKADLVIIEFRSTVFHSVKSRARLQLNRVKITFEEAKKKAKEHLKNINIENEESLIATQEEIMNSLSEVKEVEAATPEAYANDKKIAILLDNALDRLGKLTIKEALNNSIVTVSNKFIKVASKKFLEEQYQILLSKIIAKKLSLKVEDFNNNPGFEEFAKKQHIHRYLYVFGHELNVKGNTIYILFEGDLAKWEEVKSKLKYDKDGSFQGHYSKDGLVNYGLYDWDEFKPFYIERNSPPSWGKRYLCEICSWIIDKPRIQGDHTFLRLKTPKGEIYSVGQYVPSKLGYDRYMFPMSLKPSRFMSPDVSEFWNGNFTTLSFEITEAQFNKMRLKVETDKKKQMHLYQVFIDNCTIWAKSVAELADLELPSSLAVYDLIFPSVTNFGRKIHRWKYTPNFLKPMTKLLWTLILNSSGLLLGSGMVHSAVKKNENFKSAVPYIKSFKDLFDVKKGVSEHPFVIGHYVKNQVEDWRAAKIKLLNEKKDILTEKLNELKGKSNPELIPPLVLTDPQIPVEPLLAFDNGEEALFDSPLHSPNFESISSQKEARLIYSPIQSPHLTPNTKVNTIKELKQQIQIINLTIESIHYAMPDKFRKNKRKLSHESVPQVKKPQRIPLNRMYSTPNIHQES